MPAPAPAPAPAAAAASDTIPACTGETIAADALKGPDGKTVTLLVGAGFQQYGYYADSSLWANAKGEATTVFFVSRNLIEPLLLGTRHFSKERTIGD